jgi:hypothetical protein
LHINVDQKWNGLHFGRFFSGQPVNAVSEEPGHQEEDESDGGPDHDSGEESHQHDPEEGEGAAAEVRESDHPPVDSWQGVQLPTFLAFLAFLALLSLTDILGTLGINGI